MADNRRDIIQRVKVNGEDVAHQIAWLVRYSNADPAVAGPAKTIVDQVNANVAAITAAMAAYAAAAP
jgi:hypothetical protein